MNEVMYTVIYVGDLKKDPIDKGSETFKEKEVARRFWTLMKDRGYKVYLYGGVLIYESL